MGDGRRGLGRRAVDFSTLSEPANCREYIAVHQRLRVGPGIRLLDMACGSGLAIELARTQGATCAGIDDVAPGLALVARAAAPTATSVSVICRPRPGRMRASMSSPASVASGTTPAAVDEARRLLVTGGRLAMTVWGNVGKSPGGWLLAPFLWATDEKIQHQADMVALGRPGIGEAFLGERGFEVEARFEVPFAMEYPDPETYAPIAATGPAYEAIQSIGEEEFATRAERPRRGAYARRGAASWRDPGVRIRRHQALITPGRLDASKVFREVGSAVDEARSAPSQDVPPRQHTPGWSTTRRREQRRPEL